jgi:hypothetical protein
MTIVVLEQFWHKLNYFHFFHFYLLLVSKYIYIIYIIKNLQIFNCQVRTAYLNVQELET